MADTYPIDPILNHKFLITVDGIGKIGVTKISGLEDESPVVEYREGCDPIPMRKLAAGVKFSPITIERGVTKNSVEFYQWREAVKTDTVADRRTVVIQVHSSSGNLIRTYRLFKAWPSKLVLGDLDASSDEVLVESMTIEYEDQDLEVSAIAAD